MDIDASGKESLSSRNTGSLNAPRWYGTGVLLPTGEALVFSGADRDEVLLPGTAEPVTTPELFDPETETWTPVAQQGRARTYHNTALLLPDGRVLVGGHAPIPTGYDFEHHAAGADPARDPRSVVRGLLAAVPVPRRPTDVRSTPPGASTPAPPSR